MPTVLKGETVVEWEVELQGEDLEEQHARHRALDLVRLGMEAVPERAGRGLNGFVRFDGQHDRIFSVREK